MNVRPHRYKQSPTIPVRKAFKVCKLGRPSRCVRADSSPLGEQARCRYISYSTYQRILGAIADYWLCPLIPRTNKDEIIIRTLHTLHTVVVGKRGSPTTTTWHLRARGSIHGGADIWVAEGRAEWGDESRENGGRISFCLRTYFSSTSSNTHHTHLSGDAG